MEKLFVPYKLAVKLKELGLKIKGPFGYYCEENYEIHDTEFTRMTLSKYKFGHIDKIIVAPLWQQAFDWFRVEKDLYADIYRTGKLFSANIEDMLMGNSLCEVVKEVSYEEAREECLEKLIELCEKEIK